MSELAIDVRDLSVRAGRRTILSIGGLEVREGEFLGVLGPNGAGKSTLIRCCLAMQARAGGRIAVLGYRLDRLSPRRLGLLRRRIGYVPQLLSVSGEMPLTVREVVAIGRTGIAGLLRPLRRKDWRIVDEWIERLGLSALARRGYGEISGGEQRKTLIARAMVQQPRMLLLDEPTANLDLRWREQIVRTVQELYETTKLTVVLVCHELQVIPACCGRVALLRDGLLLADGTPDEVLTDERLESLYGPGFSILRRAGRMAIMPSEEARA